MPLNSVPFEAIFSPHVIRQRNDPRTWDLSWQLADAGTFAAHSKVCRIVLLLGHFRFTRQQFSGRKKGMY